MSYMLKNICKCAFIISKIIKIQEIFRVKNCWHKQRNKCAHRWEFFVTKMNLGHGFRRLSDLYILSGPQKG